MKQQAIKRLKKLEVATGIGDRITHLRLQGVSRDKDGNIVIIEGVRLKIGGGSKKPISPSFDSEEYHEES